MNNPMNIMGMYQQFRQNPMQFLMSKGLNIPQQHMNNPNDAIQYLMNNGRISQEQYNRANQQMRAMQDSPMFRQMTGQK